jgi:signal peptidase I
VLLKLAIGAAVVVGIGSGAGARLAGFSPVHVTSGSMAPAVERGDWIIVRSHNGGRDISRGDIVEFRFPLGTSGRAIKRVVAVGGDTVTFTDHTLTVNGRTRPIAGSPVPGRTETLTVPPGAVYLVGDNASVSIDSRSFGAVPGAEVVGKVVVS